MKTETRSYVVEYKGLSGTDNNQIFNCLDSVIPWFIPLRGEEKLCGLKVDDKGILELSGVYGTRTAKFTPYPIELNEPRVSYPTLTDNEKLLCATLLEVTNNKCVPVEIRNWMNDVIVANCANDILEVYLHQKEKNENRKN